MFWKLAVGVIMLPACLGIGTVAANATIAPESTAQSLQVQDSAPEYYANNYNYESNCGYGYKRRSYGGYRKQNYYRPHHNGYHQTNYYRPRHNGYKKYRHGYHNNGYHKNGHHNNGYHKNGHHNNGYHNNGYHH
jgi:hypothetical protein